MPDISSFYVSVLSQALSPCEGFLAAGTNFGNLNVFNLNRLYDGENQTNDEVQLLRSPIKTISVNNKPLQAMVSSKDSLIVGGTNCIQGYCWEALKQPKSIKEIKPNWNVDLNLPTDFGTRNSVDYLILGDDLSLYAACGDNTIYRVDLEYGKITSKFSGHEDYIHCMSSVGNQLSSASEDGTVNLWDTRKSEPVHQIVPHSDQRLQRPSLGKWIGAVAMNEDWLVCGGGPHLSLYHLRSLTMSRVLLGEDNVHGINCISFHEDSIIAGVSGPFVYHVLFSGDVTVKMPTTPLRVYNICLQKNDKKLMTVGGASGDIDICTSSKLQDQVVNCSS